MRVAILGAGFQGACTALELAARGVEVDLYDRNDRPITQAGLVNEGRIHLGFTYANDPTLRTANLMAGGALSFRANLDRWIDFDALASGWSGHSLYAIHRDSHVSPEDTRRYFEQVRSVVVDRMNGGEKDYLGANGDFLFEELDPADLEKSFDPRLVGAAFRTLERSVSTAAIAESIRSAVSASGRIRFRPGSEVTSVKREGAAFRVDHRSDDGPGSREFGQVVNALWDGRLLLDSEMGYLPGRKWLHRFKYGVMVRDVTEVSRIPSVAVTCGPFGDIVSYPNGDLYLTWYPDCVAEVSGELAPPKLPRVPSRADGRRIFANTITAMSAICPALNLLGEVDESRIDIRGGIIVAWGESDIGRRDSELHVRHEVGPFSEDGYHSIDTGKYTLAPRYALETADRVCASS